MLTQPAISHSSRIFFSLIFTMGLYAPATFGSESPSSCQKEASELWSEVLNRDSFSVDEGLDQIDLIYAESILDDGNLLNENEVRNAKRTLRSPGNLVFGGVSGLRSDKNSPYKVHLLILDRSSCEFIAHIVTAQSDKK